MAIEQVSRIDDYKGHQMIQVGNTRISLAKAMKMVDNAEAIKRIAQSDAASTTAPEKNPFA